jgi:periplasmic protein TonB
MFDTIKETDRMDGAKHFLSFLFSLFAHATGVCIVAILPLLFLKAIHEGDLTTFITMSVPPAPSFAQPIPPRRSGGAVLENKHVGYVKTNLNLFPGKIPTEILPEPPEQSWGADTGSIIGRGRFGGGDGEDGGVYGPIVNFGPPEVIKKPVELVKPIILPDPIRPGGNILPAKLISKVDPEYPRLAQLAHVSGIVSLEAVIDEEGNVTNPKIIHGDDLLNKAALDAVRQWKYSPTILNGEPVRIVAVIKVVFNIKYKS